MKLLFKTISMLLIIFIWGCVAPPKNTSNKTSLELLSIQSREFETSKKVAFASVLSVFQDLGYIVGSADFETGFITATSPIRKVGNIFYPFLNTKATAFIEELIKGHTRVT